MEDRQTRTFDTVHELLRVARRSGNGLQACLHGHVQRFPRVGSVQGNIDTNGTIRYLPCKIQLRPELVPGDPRSRNLPEGPAPRDLAGHRSPA